MARASFLLLLLLTLTLAPPSTSADPDDESCLSNLHRALSDLSGVLSNWTAAAFAAPCNGFTSPLYGATCNNGRIYKLSLSKLELAGSISPFIANCTNLQSLDLSSNALSGPIPPDLSALLNLAILNLSGNQLSGQIPPQLALCSYLNVIDLHGNRLSGQIPGQLGLLARLSAFDVSDNRLDGPIPVQLANRTGGGTRFNGSAFAGNRGLYGYPLPPARGRGLSAVAIVGIGLASGLLSLVISFTAVYVWIRITERKTAAMANGAADEGKISHLMPDY